MGFLGGGVLGLGFRVRGCLRGLNRTLDPKLLNLNPINPKLLNS